MNDRRNVPTGDGARMPSNARCMPACRSRSVSVMLSAPATIPASTDITLAPALAPPLCAAPVIFTVSSTSPGRPPRPASATTGTSPTAAIRFGSSNTTFTAAAA